MRSVIRLAGAAAIATATLTALALPASAATVHRHRPAFGGRAYDAVFVQTDNTAGNSVVAYHRAADGTLTQAGQYTTGGVGGVLAGSVVDHLASQVSLSYDPATGTLIAVNAGSDTVSVFGAHGDRLHLRQVISSGGAFPVSVTIRDGLVYVLNALDGGSVQGYRLFLGRLFPLAGSSRALGLDPTATPQFVNTPGQVAFSPDGAQLIVTTKANGSDVDVYAVRRTGRLSQAPVVNSEPGAVPFKLRRERSPRHRRGGHQCARHLRPQRDRNCHAAGCGRHRRDRHLLGNARGRVLLRLECGQRIGIRLLRQRCRRAGPGRQHGH